MHLQFALKPLNKRHQMTKMALSVCALIKGVALRKKEKTNRNPSIRGKDNVELSTHNIHTVISRSKR